FEGDYALDSVTAVSGTLDIAVTQDSANAPGTSPTIAMQPLVLTGDGEIEGSREFGRFVVSGRAGIGRTVYGTTTLTDTSIVDNSAQNNTRLTGGLRLGFRVTPILTAFIDASVARQAYD